MDSAINAVRGRYLALQAPQQPPSALDAALAVTGGGDDDEDYEPEYPTEDAEQLINKLDNSASDGLGLERRQSMPLGPFKLEQPPPLTDQETAEWSKGTVQRVFGVISALDETVVTAKPPKAGLNRLAANTYDRDAWVTVVSRLASRAPAGLEGDDDDAVKKEGVVKVSRNGTFELSNAVREALNLYIIQDFRRRIDLAISWLNEEWYADMIRAKEKGDDASSSSSSSSDGEIPQHYEKWMLAMLDAMLPYLDAKDKLLIRFLSEIPGLGKEVLDRVKRLASDPERVPLAVSAIHYLILLRPPVREICIDALEDLWRNYDDAKGATAKLLQKWRPHVLQEVPNGTSAGVEVKEESKMSLTAET
ncbi:hypothetical protein LTS18_009407 [Coniosporium uncinatum]|uniref:Uncharacterized protein n=1 Tax=Coniosporium uncinatum TaxID=93489 RepID=A0ACC3DML0_9PEZI|nr:hypothetical protein LTS18_009407 [Coniosporium uncinatum]